MTTTLTVENPMYLSEVKIPHLGPVRKGYLKEWFHVDTVQGLAALSADDVEARFKAERKTVSRDKIEGWIAKARELAAIANLPSQRAVGLASAEVERKANSPTTDGKWKDFAEFVVVFQVRKVKGRPEEQKTKAEDMHTGTRKEWDGIEVERLCQWMLEQVSEKVSREPIEDEPRIEISITKSEVVRTEEISPEEAKALFDDMEAKRKVAEEAAVPEAALPEASIVTEEPSIPSMAVKIVQIQAFQPPQAEMPVGIGKAGQPFQGFIRGSEPFALAVSFVLPGPGADDIVKRRTKYNAHFYVRNLTTKKKIPLGDTKIAPLVEGEAPYTALLSQTSLQPGLYHLWALVTLQSTPPRRGYLEMPMLQVV